LCKYNKNNVENFIYKTFYCFFYIFCINKTKIIFFVYLCQNCEMLSKSLKNIHSLNKNKYSEKDSILNKIYYKNNYLIKLNELKSDFYKNLFNENFYINDYYSIMTLNKLVYLYKKYNFFVFNDIESILFILSVCCGEEEFKFFYEIFKEKYSNEKEKILENIFAVSILYDNFDVFNFLNSKESIKIKTPAFILAIKYGNIKIVNYFISRKIDINIKDEEYKRTPLIWAVVKGHIEIVKLLIDSGADINEKDGRNKKTPLIWAIYSGNIEIAKLLINKGAEINEKDDDSYKRTPLIWAITEEHTEIAKLLIDKGANINEKDESEIHKKTPLIWAIYMGNIEIAKLLIDKGAKVNERDFYGKNALDYAETDEIKQLLLEAMEKQKQQNKS